MAPSLTQDKLKTVLDKYEEQFYSVLDHKWTQVRKECLTLVAHLALTDIIRVKVCFPYICKLLLDENDEIQAIAKLFLEKLHSKSKNLIK